MVRLIVYDRTCVKTRGRLSPIWATGAKLYRALRNVDAVQGVASWDEAFAWVTSHDAPIREIQYWGHGKWGSALVDNDVLDRAALAGPRRKQLEAVRERLAPDALVWFRTCETLGARAGHDFAQRLADFLGARVAGHTYIIGFHQSGLHGLAPGMQPDWSPEEGLAEGDADQPERAKWSKPWAPRTITCLTSSIPDRWFAQSV